MTIVARQTTPTGTITALHGPPGWQAAMKAAIRDPRELCRMLALPEEFARRAELAAAEFPLFVPREYLARIRPGDPHDPLLRQVLPIDRELKHAPGFVPDPVADLAATRVAGLLVKYTGRALMVTTGACAVHCRYCFRRHFPYSEAPRSLANWEPALKEIADDSSLTEVILSGGDPLTIVDEVLAALASRLASLPHLRRLRVHTRLPIVIPQRVCDDLLNWLRGSRLTPIMVVHANHPAELDASVEAALARLIDAGIPILNQAVLLAGVNDSADVLAELCLRLVELRVIPYYVHQLDRVAGAAHFETPERRGLEILAELRRRLPGYAVPRYAREVPGESSKRILY